MTTKHLTLSFTPEDFSWLIRKAESLGKFPDQYVEELIDRERRRDGATDSLRAGEVRHLKTADSHQHIYDADSDCIVCGESSFAPRESGR